MLNRIWLGFFLVAFLTCLVQASLGGQPEIFAAVVDACFKAARLAVEVAIGLVGLLCFWLGCSRLPSAPGLSKSSPGC